MGGVNPLHDAAGLARDALYVSVGFGLLGYNKAQVRRRELERTLAGLGDTAATVVAGTPLEGPVRLLTGRHDDT